jgi:predicted permease
MKPARDAHIALGRTRGGCAPLFFGVWQDVRYAARGLVQRPGFTAAIVLTMALGIGANAAVFSVVDAAFLRPLPFAQPDHLVHLWEEQDVRGERSETSYPDFLDIRQRNRSLSGLAGYQRARLTLSTSDRALVLAAAKVTANFFDVLGVRPEFGRRFTPGEDDVGAAPVALLTHTLWMRAFGGDHGIVGRVVQLDGVPYTVVGILPRGFEFAGAQSADVWVPIDPPPSARERRGNHWLNAVARLRDGVGIEQARRDLARVMSALAREYPETNTGRDLVVVPLHQEFVGAVRPLLLTIYGAVAFVLLIACGNVANLLLMRGTARQRELSIRAALGAGRGRIARQLLVESMMLALLGGALGVVVAHLGVRGLLAAIPAEQVRAFPYLQGVAINGTVLGYTFVLSLLAGAAFGLLPALRAARTELPSMLRQGAAGSGTASQRTLRDGLVIAELALTVVLVSGAALFARSLVRLLAVDVGFRAEHVLTMMIPLPRGTYDSDQSQRAFYRALEQRVAALPGVKNVGFTSKLPLDAGNTSSYAVAGAPPPEPGHELVANYRVVNPQYFRTLGIPFLEGRTFTATEDTTTGLVLVINRAMARVAFGDRDPIGQRINFSGTRGATVIGVVGDVTIGKLEDAIPPTMYLSYLQAMESGLRMAVRTSGDQDALVPSIRAILHQLDPAVATYQVYAMEDLIGQSRSVFLRRYPLVLVGSFAVVALVLALIGTYGVISYSVAQRFRELGIRIALGAPSGAIRGLVLRHAALLAAAGVGVGLVASAGFARLASSLMYGISGSQGWIAAAVAGVLVLMVLAAVLLPVRRATRVDPMVVLRGE